MYVMLPVAHVGPEYLSRLTNQSVPDKCTVYSARYTLIGQSTLPTYLLIGQSTLPTYLFERVCSLSVILSSTNTQVTFISPQ